MYCLEDYYRYESKARLTTMETNLSHFCVFLFMYLSIIYFVQAQMKNFKQSLDGGVNGDLDLRSFYSWFSFHSNVYLKVSF